MQTDLIAYNDGYEAGLQDVGGNGNPYDFDTDPVRWISWVIGNEDALVGLGAW